jgi:hypothetical protein
MAPTRECFDRVCLSHARDKATETVIKQVELLVEELTE